MTKLHKNMRFDALAHGIKITCVFNISENILLTQVQDPRELGQQLLHVLAAARRRALRRTGQVPRTETRHEGVHVRNQYTSHWLDPDLVGSTLFCRIRIKKYIPSTYF